jgi:hypothetical protein
MEGACGLSIDKTIATDFFDTIHPSANYYLSATNLVVGETTHAGSKLICMGSCATLF